MSLKTSPQQYPNLFALPTDLLGSLVERTLSFNAPPPPQSRPSSPLARTSNATGKTCQICHTSFDTVDLQREHFKSDWHRYNVKIKMNNAKTNTKASSVSEEAFANMVEGFEVEDSLSGSASSSSSDNDDDEEDDDDDDLRVFNKQRRSRLPNALEAVPDDEGGGPHQKVTRSNIIWFHSASLSTQIGVYRTLFRPPPPDTYLDQLRAFNAPDSGGGGDDDDGGPMMWAFFMVAGGHFAGAIVRIERGYNKSGTSEKAKHQTNPIQVVHHKTFHRYTTRRKQGGSQSANDNAKGGPAKSAGALLRRYGELSLQADIRALLASWADPLSSCSSIFLRASKQNRKIFWGYEGEVIAKGDERVKGIPFATRRPTLGEVKRCVEEMVRPKVGRLSDEEIKEKDEEVAQRIKLEAEKRLEKIKEKERAKERELERKAENAAPVLTAEDQTLQDKWLRLIEMVTKGRTESARSFWLKEREASLGGVNSCIPEFVGKGRHTFLSLCSVHSQPMLVDWLLKSQNADPSVVVVIGGKEETAYSLAGDRETRDVFRRCAEEGLGGWDWFGKGKVESGLTKEMEQKRKLRDEKKKVRMGALRERVKGREKEAGKEEEEEPEEKGKASLGSVTDGLVGVSPEMRLRIERERRARAAEARLAALKK